MKPKDFSELMTGLLALLIVGAVLIIGGHAIWSGAAGAEDFRGHFITLGTLAAGYFLGSSMGSKRKTDDAAALTKTATISAEVAKVTAVPEPSISTAQAENIKEAVQVATSKPRRR